MDTSWINQFPALAALPEAERRLITDHSARMQLPVGTTVFAPGIAAENFLLVLGGTVRVQQVSASGREIVLYRVTGGETCIMTTACLFSEESYSAEGVVETEVDAVAIPKSAFDEAIARSPGFRRIVFSDYSHRISDVMHVLEDVAFERLDKRVAHHLVSISKPGQPIQVTQQELASELGTAREVVGRMLKEFERRGLVTLSRGAITVTNLAGLSHIAAVD